MSNAEAFQVSRIESGVVAGPFRAPRNLANDNPGSIHDDATAQKLGFRGGTVAGSLHMEQFPPLLADVLGRRWYQNGSLSLYFRYATRDDEDVRCFAREPQDPEAENIQIEVWMDDAEGHRVADGTASVGVPDRDSALRQRIAATPEPGEVRILDRVEIGRRCEGIAARVDKKALNGRLEVVTERIAGYTDESEWGGLICTPAMMVRLMRPVERELWPRDGSFGVGLFGAIELQNLRGPVFVDREYTARGEVLKIGETPKTEYVWYESVISEGGEDVASMLMMLRFMKASSPRWQESA
ncbi:MAG: hypothetical protein P8Y95_03760 [Gammaproteobacteria bacterium]|jgi:hypothetical protein